MLCTFSRSASTSLITKCGRLARERSARLTIGQQWPASSSQQINVIFGVSRPYSALSKDEEEEEKRRVEILSPYQKEMELRDLDAKIAKLNTLRGINTGELYTMRGKFKALARDYGVGFMVWYWCVWVTTCGLTYVAIDVGDVDAMAILARVDNWTGWDLSNKVDPTLGTIGLTIAVNELLEPLRLPIVVFTVKPVVDFFSKR
eukprot:CAMPEP_0183329504 /NCGR_PEP_ID=MMETSP0160_2-20130417/84828_1 /TAXON_ID=2839 ORGANISM="Odontella Sinensis, Strain Grunow 1884" /NCGR_SAMPLE_ID=MMETSP0160_2 /ASSEMBLY_ACC=CAM_ASM_000250 /LENGTH=202 /DNA_ID=CAMNT_0025497695 /DNA_START=105 /DNA_END=713 /DNA_ORIENTATION=-